MCSLGTSIGFWNRAHSGVVNISSSIDSRIELMGDWSQVSNASIHSDQHQSALWQSFAWQELAVPQQIVLCGRAGILVLQDMRTFCYYTGACKRVAIISIWLWKDMTSIWYVALALNCHLSLYSCLEILFWTTWSKFAGRPIYLMHFPFVKAMAV